MFHLFSYSFQLPRTTRTHNSVLYPGANQRFSILCWWQRNKSYSRGWISVSLQLKIKKGRSKDLKKLCLCMASLVLSTRPAVHKQSFLNLLLRQNGRHLTKVYNLRHFMAVERWGRGGGQEACTKHLRLQNCKQSVFWGIQVRASSRTKGLEQGWNTGVWGSRLLHLALPISLLILRKKPTVLQSNQTLDSFVRSVCDRTVSYLVISW